MRKLQKDEERFAKVSNHAKVAYDLTSDAVLPVIKPDANMVCEQCKEHKRRVATTKPSQPVNIAPMESVRIDCRVVTR